MKRIDREISYNEFIENVELEFKLNNSMFEYMKFVRRDIEVDLENNTEEMKKLKSLVMTAPFQAGLVRTSRNGTHQYEELIETGNEYLKELEDSFNIDLKKIGIIKNPLTNSFRFD